MDVTNIKILQRFTVINPRKIDLTKFIIYKFTNIDNGKIYIGKTIDINERFRGHNKYRKDKYSYFSNALKKHGKKKFVCEFLMDCEDEYYLLKAETAFIQYYKSSERKYGYNLTEGGDGVTPNKQTRAKMSAAAQRNKKIGEASHRYKKLTQEEIDYIKKEYSISRLSLEQVKKLFEKKFNKICYRKKIYDTLKKHNIPIRSREEQTSISIKGKTVEQISDKAAVANQKRFTRFEDPIKSYVIDARTNQKMSLQNISKQLRLKFNYIASERVIRQNLKFLGIASDIRSAWSERIAKSHMGKTLSLETKQKLSKIISEKHKNDKAFHDIAIRNLNKPTIQ